MSAVVAALTFGGSWKIYDKDSIKTSFPTFITKIKALELNLAKNPAKKALLTYLETI